MSGPPLPPALAARPIWQGYPVPWIVDWPPGGAPDFKAFDAGRHRRCVDERLCQLCGELVGYWIAFIGGPSCVREQLFSDPGMHEDCARYAMAVCPFLANPSAGYATETGRPDRQVFELVSTASPERMALYITRGYRAELHRGSRYIRVDPVRRLEWFRQRPGAEQ